MKHSKR